VAISAKNPRDVRLPPREALPFMNPRPSFSIVICTDSRLRFLRQTLESLKYLTHDNFEVCVVHGPTADGAKAYLDTQRPRVKVASCPVRNLSVARNIGIAMSAGDIVAFIDDDAVPEAEWLNDLAEAFQDPSVGAAGGFVYDHTGVDFQYKFVTTDRLGYSNSRWWEPADNMNFPFSTEYPHLLGTNCAFRRDLLLELGGFDEEYEYFLDETDLCCRVNDAGYVIAQLAGAYVHHKFAPSPMRDQKRVVSQWYPLIKNRVYFGMRNGRHHHSLREIVQAGFNDAADWERSVRELVALGGQTEADLARFLEESEAAIADGLERGRSPMRAALGAATRLAHQAPFAAYSPLLPPRDRRVVCIVSQDYPPGHNGGIARHVSQLARSLAEAGHHVHVLTRARGPASVMFEDNVWVHRIGPRPHPGPGPSPIAPLSIPGHIWDYSATMLEEVKAIDARRKVDVVYCPLWDCEPIAFVVDGAFPVICALQTTMKFWLESQPSKQADLDWMGEFGAPILAMERFIIERATRLHANSRAIVADIERKYEIAIPACRLYHSPHGLEDWAGAGKQTHADDGVTRVLFVGRLESRKGIDVVLDIAPDLLRDHPDVVLDIVGDDTIRRSDGATHKEAFEARELDPLARARVRFHGRVEEEALRGFYRRCDIFIAPSRYESFGLVYLEAMMFGKSVIGGRPGGGPEVIEEGRSGWLVEAGDGAGLRAALETLLADPDKRRAMGRAARARYEAMFTDRRPRDDLLEVVEALRRPGGEPSAEGAG
jgi:glycogen(starch) synthase